jgi:hypothetical protein
MDITTPAEAERHVATLADELTTPEEGECVLCFAHAMLDRFGCDGSLRWVRRWRDVLRPRMTGLERRMGSRGGYCDCEVFFNGWDLLPELMVRDAAGDLDWPPVMPVCAGVGPRSSQPCALWEPRRRY